MYVGCIENNENAGKLTSQNLRSDKDIKKSGYGINSNLFQNLTAFHEVGSDRFVCHSTLLGFSNVILIC